MPDLPTVSEAFEADIGPFVAAILEARDAMLEAAAAAKTLQETIDSLHGKTIDIGVKMGDASTGVGGIAPAADEAAAAVRNLAVAWTAEEVAQKAADGAAAAFGRDVAATAAAVEDLNIRIEDAKAAQAAYEYSILQARIANAEYDRSLIDTGKNVFAVAELTQKLGPAFLVSADSAKQAAAGADKAAWSFRLWGTGLRITGTMLHWIVAGVAEFLAVAVPAALALGAGLAVAAQGAQNVQQHFQALYAATESTANAMHTTVGDVLGLGHALQSAQNAANPGVYEVLGSVIQDAKTRFADFAGVGLQVVHMLDEFAARVTVDLQGALGAQLHGLLSGMVTDLQQFGQIIGNIGHALLNFASAMPGLARVLLAVADAVSHVLLVISSIPAPIITAVMALEEFYRWGGLALNLLLRLAAAPAAMAAWFQGANFIRSFGQALSTIIQFGGIAIQWVGQMVGKFTAAGAAIETFGADVSIAAATMDPMLIAGIAGAVAGLGVLAVMLARTKNATEQWIAASDQMVQRASDLSVLPTIYNQLADTSIKLAAAQNQANTAAKSFAATVSGSGRFGAEHLTQGNLQASASVTELANHFVALVATANTVRSNLSLLAGVFHTSTAGALALANAAGINLQVGLTKGSEAAKIAEQQIINLKAGLGAMAAPAGVIGADMQAVGVQSQLAASKVQTVNQALDAFVATTTGGMNQIMQFNAQLHTMGNDAISSSVGIDGAVRSISRSAAAMGYTLQGIGPKAQQSWQQFDAAVQQGNSILDTFRTGMAEGVVSWQQYQAEIKAVGGALLPFAAHSQTALAIVSQLAQQMGAPATTNLKTLAADFGITGRAAQQMATVGMEQAIAKMANLNVIARNLSVTVGTQLDTAMASAITKFSGVQGAAQNYAKALANANTPASVLARAQAAFNTALQREQSMTTTATGDLNKHTTALSGLATGYKHAATGASDYTKSSQNVNSALQDTIARARDAGVSTQGFGTQAHAAAGAAQGLSSNATQATANVRNLGNAATTTRGSLGTVNNEIRTTASAASSAAGPLSNMTAMIRGVGASASAAAGQVRGLEAAIASLQSKTVTVNVVTVTSTIHRQHGGPVWPGGAFTVGEAGPELFVPSQPGVIIPAPETRFLTSPSSGATFTHTTAAGGGELTAVIHNHVNLDGEEIWRNQQRRTLRYNVRQGNSQSGIVSPVSMATG